MSSSRGWQRGCGWTGRRGSRLGCGRLGWHGLAFTHDGDVLDDHRGERFIFRRAVNTGDGRDELDGASVALAEDGVLAVELGDRLLRDEELGAVGPGAGIGHGEAAWDVVGEGGDKFVVVEVGGVA